MVSSSDSIAKATAPYSTLPAATWRSTLTLGFDARQHKTRLIKRQHCGALQVQRALYPEPASKTAANRNNTNINTVNQSGICHGIILYPPAGIAAGDKLKITLELAKDSHAVLTTPGAGKWYGKEAVDVANTNNKDNKQAAANFASQHITAVVEESATLEWLPQESIVFNHANMQASARFDLAATSSLLTWDIVVFGRQAYEEVFASGQYRNELAIYRDGKLIVFENSNHAAGSRWFTSPLAMNRQHVIGTFWAVPALIAIEQGVDPDPNVNSNSNQDSKARHIQHHKGYVNEYSLKPAINMRETIATLRKHIEREALPVVCTQVEQALCIRYLGTDVQACFAAFALLRDVLRHEWWQLTAHQPRIWDT